MGKSTLAILVTLAVGLGVGFLLGGACSGKPDDAATTRLTSDAIEAGNVDSWRRAIREHADERAAIADGLLAVAMDKNRNESERAHAIVYAARIRADAALKFCAEHMDLRGITAATSLTNPNLRPCESGLRVAGWAAIPPILEAMTHKELNAEQHAIVTRVLVRIAGHEVAFQLMVSVARTANSEPLRENVFAVLGLLIKAAPVARKGLGYLHIGAREFLFGYSDGKGAFVVAGKQARADESGASNIDLFEPAQFRSIEWAKEVRFPSHDEALDLLMEIAGIGRPR